MARRMVFYNFNQSGRHFHPPWPLGGVMFGKLLLGSVLHGLLPAPNIKYCPVAAVGPWKLAKRSLRAGADGGVGSNEA